MSDEGGDSQAGAGAGRAGVPGAARALDLEARPVRLLDLARERPLLLVFLRHYG